ncbi:MAG: hypothetical protein WBZ19_21075 [Chthoniobacterales bacterium]
MTTNAFEIILPFGSCTLTLTSGFPLLADTAHAVPNASIAAIRTTILTIVVILLIGHLSGSPPALSSLPQQEDLAKFIAAGN